MVEAEVFVGIDVSKDQLDIAVRPGKKFFTISNDDSGIKALVQRLLSLKPQLVVLEAAGGYEIPAVYALDQASLPLAIMNPRIIREFARSAGKLAKTDKIDAQVLAHYAEVMRPQPRPLREAEQLALASGYLNPKEPGRFRDRLQRLASRTQLLEDEAQLLHGLSREILKRLG